MMNSKRYISGKEIVHTISSYLSKVEREICFFSAFCKANVLEELVKNKNFETENKKLIVRWKIRDLVQEVSDLECYNIAKKNGWSFYINNDLHAKCYIFDNYCLLGSSNLTYHGLSLHIAGNVEMNYLCEVDKYILQWKEKVIDNSIKVDDILFDSIKKDISTTNHSIIDNLVYSPKTTMLMKERSISFSIDSEQLFWTNDPEKVLSLEITNNEKETEVLHDIYLLNVTNETTLHELKERFLYSKAWLWLSANAYDGAFYGELTERLHREIGLSSSIKRRKVKLLLSNLLDWAKALVPEYIEITVPNYSSFIKILEQKK